MRIFPCFSVVFRGLSFRGLIGIALLLLVAKVAWVASRGPAPIVLDAAEYWDLSSLVLNGDVWLLSEPIAYRTPLYPWFLAVVRSASGTLALPAIVLVQVLLYVAAVTMAARLSWRISGSHAAALLTVVMMLLPIAATTFTTALLTETLFTALLVTNLLAVVRYVQTPTTGNVALAALTFALTLLTRPVVLGLWVPHLIFVVASRRSASVTSSVDQVASLRRLAMHGLVAGGIVAVLIGPWVIRNQVLFGRPFLTEFLGRNIWIVAFQGGSASEFDLPKSEAGQELRRRIEGSSETVDWRATWAVSDALGRSGLDDASVDRLMKRVALDAIKQHPAAFLEKAFRRMVNFWRSTSTNLPGFPPTVVPEQPRKAAEPWKDQRAWSWPSRLRESWIDHRWSLSVTGNTAVAALIAVATLIMMIQPATRWYGCWITMIFLYFTFITGLVEIPAYRYRMVLEPILATVIAVAAHRIWLAVPAIMQRQPKRHCGPERAEVTSP